MSRVLMGYFVGGVTHGVSGDKIHRFIDSNFCMALFITLGVGQFKIDESLNGFNCNFNFFRDSRL